MKFVTADQVRALREATPPAAVLDVRLPEDHTRAHLAGAQNACVFEVGFIDAVRRLLPDLSAPLVVYGAGPHSLESTDAARRLHEAGYTAVHNFVGGLVEWRKDGLPVLGEGETAVPAVLEGERPVDLAETRIEWTGRNLLNKHWGTVGLRSGRLIFRQGWLSGGEFVIDMTSLACADLSETAANQALLRHLRSSDFFDVDHHPEARFLIKQTAPVPQGRQGAPNLQIVGDLTLRGITRELTLVAVAGRTPEGRVAAQALVAFDRTDWGSAYGSGRFFQSLGRHLVNDLIEVQVRLLA